MKWLPAFPLGDLDDEWESLPRTSGVYMILCGRAVGRVGGTDPQGILYIGKAGSLRQRLHSFWYAQHGASAYLWENKAIGRLVLRSKGVEAGLGKLRARVATPIPGPKRDRLEKALLFAYLSKYGETPPLNSSLPKRWEKVSPDNLRWAKAAILK